MTAAVFRMPSLTIPNISFSARNSTKALPRPTVTPPPPQAPKHSLDVPLSAIDRDVDPTPVNAAPPRPLVCSTCQTYVAAHAQCLSRKFRGYSGLAGLFTEAYNVLLGPPSVTLMATGVHTLQELACATCRARLGWKILSAKDSAERWKENKYLLELELIEDDPNGSWSPSMYKPRPPMPAPRGSSMF